MAGSWFFLNSATSSAGEAAKLNVQVSRANVTSASPPSFMLTAMRAKSPFSQSAWFGLMAGCGVK